MMGTKATKLIRQANSGMNLLNIKPLKQTNLNKMVDTKTGNFDMSVLNQSIVNRSSAMSAKQQRHTDQSN